VPELVTSHLSRLLCLKKRSFLIQLSYGFPEINDQDKITSAQLAAASVCQCNNAGSSYPQCRETRRRASGGRGAQLMTSTSHVPGIAAAAATRIVVVAR
jgi:hypothetical protein